MNTKIKLLALSAAVLTLGACSDDNDNEASSKYITIATEIGTMTRVTTAADGTQNFAEGDSISVYAWTGDPTAAPAAGKRVVDNSVNTLTSGKWMAKPQMLWKDIATNHYFIAVYPSIARGMGLDTDLTQYAYTLNTADQEASDLLVAVNTSGRSALDGDVPLDFAHTMATVNVNLSFRNQWGTDSAGNNTKPTVSSVSLADAADGATVNLFSKAVTADNGSRKDIAIPEVEANSKYKTIFIPQGGVQRVVIVVGGKTYTYTHPTDIIFESGKITTVNLIVGRNEVVLGGLTISNWSSNPDINGEAQED